MQIAKSLTPLAAAILALGLSACGTMDLRSETAMTPIEVIESNYVESTLDAEVVLNDTPSVEAILVV